MSRAFPYFKLYTANFIHGTMAMTAAEVGDYVRLLCLIYDQNGKVKNDSFALRHALGCNRPREARIKLRRLVELGKLSVDKEGFIHNGRADEELKKRIVAETGSEASDTLPAQPKNSINSTRARTRVRRKILNTDNLESSFHASDLFNGTAAAALGALGCEGRAPSPPIGKAARAPPSALVQMLVEQGLHKRH